MRCDLLIANRGARLLGLVPRARRRLFWLHNPARYLKKPRNLWPLARYRPTLVLCGRHHAGTVPRWVPRRGEAIMPYGLLAPFRDAEPREPPPPRAVFTSNPLRGLDWLLDLWAARIAPAVPKRSCTSIAARRCTGPTAIMRGAWRRCWRASRRCTKRRAPPPAGPARGGGRRAGAVAGHAVSRRSGRGVLHRAGRGAVDGLPVVVQPVGMVAERVVDGVTGIVAADDAAFAAAAIALLRDDEMWRRFHRGRWRAQRGLSWDEVASRYEALIG